MNPLEAFAQGVQFHRAGDLSRAEHFCRQALLADPHHRDALHLLGLLAIQSGKVEEGIDSIRRALAVDPACAQAHFDLASALRGLGRLDEAAEAYWRVLALEPTNAPAHTNLAHVRKAQGRLSEAIEHYQLAIGSDPGAARAHLGLGTLLGDEGRLAEAEACFRRAVQLDPDDSEARRALAVALSEQGRDDEAALTIREALRLRPDDATTRFVCAALTGEGTPSAAPREYVAGLFDSYSAIYDDHLLTRLDYRGPRLLREAVADLAETGACDILDLGCGTGLCGAAVSDLAKTLTGVDLSAGMLARARGRGIYHRLIEGDLLDALNASPAAFHLILAGDVFTYIGDLAAIFTAVRRALLPGGRFAFLVEAQEETDYVLRATKRFAHSLGYLRGLARSAGLVELNARAVVLRKESGRDVEGYAVTLRVP